MRFNLLLIALGAACVLGAQDTAPTPPPGAPPAPAPGAARPGMPDPNKPAGEAFKNVQLLKDIPAGQFFQTMRTISASLGVKCSFCHVEGNFAADDKEQKKTARMMITMAGSINKQFFNGEREVHCYTCHHGASHPVSAPPAAAGGPAPGAPPHPDAPPPAQAPPA